MMAETTKGLGSLEAEILEELEDVEVAKAIRPPMKVVLGLENLIVRVEVV